MADAMAIFILDLSSSLAAGSTKTVKIGLADELLSVATRAGEAQHMASIVNHLEITEGHLVPSFGGNLPMTDTEFLVTRQVLNEADVLVTTDAPSQSTYTKEQGSSLLVEMHRIALTVPPVAKSNADTRVRRAKFRSLDKTLQPLQFVFGKDVACIAVQQNVSQNIERKGVLLGSHGLKLPPPFLPSGERVPAKWTDQRILPSASHGAVALVRALVADDFSAAGLIRVPRGAARERIEADGTVLGRW